MAARGGRGRCGETGGHEEKPVAARGGRGRCGETGSHEDKPRHAADSANRWKRAQSAEDDRAAAALGRSRPMERPRWQGGHVHGAHGAAPRPTDRGGGKKWVLRGEHEGGVGGNNG